MKISRAYIESVGERVFDAYSRLPEVADSDICRVEPELLIKRMLGLSLDYQYLSPDESILGVTSFEPIVITVFDIRNRPFFYQMDGKTILIDSLLRYEATQRGRCNYTMMHEASHQILKMMFPKEYSAASYRKAPLYCKSHSKLQKPITDWEEWQANTLASSILLPACLVRKALRKFGVPDKIRLLSRMYDCKMFEQFSLAADHLGASKAALAIRMKRLGMLETFYLADPMSPIFFAHEEVGMKCQD